MQSRIAPLVTILAFAAAAPLAAQGGQGTYSTVPTASDTMVMPGNAVHMLFHYQQVTLATAPAFPIHNTKGDCIGMMRIEGEKPVAGSGSCFAQGTDGHGYSMWWQLTESGTTTCADICGTWGVYGGYGRFAGLSGGGTWKRGALFMDGSSSGTWMGTLTKK